MQTQSIPIIDISSLLDEKFNLNSSSIVAREINAACCEDGIFYITGHGVPPSLVECLDTSARRFFSLPLEAREEGMNMSLGGRSYRGYFPVSAELTGGKPDVKEGVYFGTELGDDHPLVIRKTPLHGKNLFPDKYVPKLRAAVLEYMSRMTVIGQRLMSAIAVSLNLEPDYFSDYMTDPMVLFMMFNYPAVANLKKACEGSWGVSEHTDYGVLTILKQDPSGGLQFKSTKSGEWIEAPAIPDTFICNLGDMMERMTGGLYKSTLHRARNVTKNMDRISFPLFFGPNFNSLIKPIEGCIGTKEAAGNDMEVRWDGDDLQAFDGTYGDYLLSRVARVFPKLEPVLMEGYSLKEFPLRNRNLRENK